MMVDGFAARAWLLQLNAQGGLLLAWHRHMLWMCGVLLVTGPEFVTQDVVVGCACSWCPELSVPQLPVFCWPAAVSLPCSAP